MPRLLRRPVSVVRGPITTWRRRLRARRVKSLGWGPLAIGCGRALGTRHSTARRVHGIHSPWWRHRLPLTRRVVHGHCHASGRRTKFAPRTSRGSSSRPVISVAIRTVTLVVLIRRSPVRPLRDVHATHPICQLRFIVVAASRVRWRVRLRPIARKSVTDRAPHLAIHRGSALRSYRESIWLAVQVVNRDMGWLP